MPRTPLLILLALLAACDKPQTHEWQGYIEGEYVMLASPYAGQLQKLYVRRGEQVAAGKPLFALEQESERAARTEAEERMKSAQAKLENVKAPRRPPEIAALREQLNQAKAALELSSAALTREEELFTRGFSSKARRDDARTARERDAAKVKEAEAQLKNAQMPLGREGERESALAEMAAAKAALAQAAWRLEQKSVAAPASGLVQDTFFVEGEWVPAGRPVASILPPGNVKARFYVPESVVGAIQIGRPVEIRCDGCPAPIAAQVSFVSAQAEYTPPVLYSKDSRAKLSFLVEARPQPADAAKLRPGQPIDVTLK
ncbi:MAG: HlyD family efflux transporter periplasmic adaptor subunit [Betaproteobacteria bacterium]|nr:MAG: HlyD family efflux transporter periplasmic adaptor subunit [Betaproteobacteria bacterium]